MRFGYLLDKGGTIMCSRHIITPISGNTIKVFLWVNILSYRRVKPASKDASSIKYYFL